MHCGRRADGFRERKVGGGVVKKEEEAFWKMVLLFSLLEAGLEAGVVDGGYIAKTGAKEPLTLSLKAERERENKVHNHKIKITQQHQNNVLENATKSSRTRRRGGKRGTSRRILFLSTTKSFPSLCSRADCEKKCIVLCITLHCITITIRERECEGNDNNALLLLWPTCSLTLETCVAFFRFVSVSIADCFLFVATGTTVYFQSNKPALLLLDLFDSNENFNCATKFFFVPTGKIHGLFIT